MTTTPPAGGSAAAGPPQGSAPQSRPAWSALTEHHAKIRDTHLRDLFASDPDRGERLTAEAAGLYLDYSKNRITDETLALLTDLAVRVGPARADRGDVLRRADQHHGEPLGAARRPADARGRDV